MAVSNPATHGPTPSGSGVTLVEPPARPTERPSIALTISHSGSRILNAVVADSAGRPLYTMLSEGGLTKVRAQRDNGKVATIDWDRSSPRMVFRGKKVKCKEWLPRASPDTEIRMFTHGDSQLKWLLKSDRGVLIPANRKGLAVARWLTDWSTGELHLQIFQEALVEPGLLEAILLSVIILQSGRPFGDTQQELAAVGPKFYAANLTLASGAVV